MYPNKTQSIGHHKLYGSALNNNVINFLKHSNKDVHHLEQHIKFPHSINRLYLLFS